MVKIQHPGAPAPPPDYIVSLLRDRVSNSEELRAPLRHFCRGMSLEAAVFCEGQVGAAPQAGWVSRKLLQSAPREPLQLQAGEAGSHSQPGSQSGSTGLQGAASMPHSVGSKPWTLQT